MAHRLTCTERGSNKFWEGSTNGKALTVTFGRIGTAGQTKTKTFSNAATAERELQNLVKEKLGKGYIEERANRASKSAPRATSKQQTAKPARSKQAHGRHLQALLAAIVDSPKRKKKAPGVVAKWLKVETRADVRALLEAVTEHDPGYLSVGDFMIHDEAFGGRVGGYGDAADRTDVVAIGRSGGPDIFVIATPGTSTSSKVTQLDPRDDWKEVRSSADLDDLLRRCVAAARAHNEETELDVWLK